MIDSHLHISFDPDPELFVDTFSPQVDAFVLASYDLEDARNNLELTKKSNIYAFVGVHPLSESPFDEDEAAELLGMPRILGIGECGLDKRGNVPAQLEILKRQLDLACQMDRPVCVHLVGCHQEFLEAITPLRGRLRGFIHGFTGSLELYEKYSSFGFKISVGTQILQRGKRIMQVLGAAGVDCILVESDYDGHVPYDPENLARTAEVISGIKGYDCTQELDLNAKKLIEGVI